MGFGTIAAGHGTSNCPALSLSVLIFILAGCCYGSDRQSPPEIQLMLFGCVQLTQLRRQHHNRPI